jgi:hypothetical protein
VLTSPLAPLQLETSRGLQRYLWLERGVEERGGEAPSHILSPSQTIIKKRALNINLFERGIKGGSIEKQP